jgi:hypothetical protein
MTGKYRWSGVEWTGRIAVILCVFRWYDFICWRYALAHLRYKLCATRVVFADFGMA